MTPPPAVLPADPAQLGDGRIGVVDLLRGLAAAAVCWFHFTNGNEESLPDGWLKDSGRLGYLGVDVFFVVSGFVLPYSLLRGGFTLRSVPTFVAKRVVRLDPPVYVVIAVELALGWLAAQTPGFRGPPFVFDPVQLLLHLGYLNAVWGYQWAVPVLWTLGIEFQFYLLVAVAFPLLAHRRPAVRAAAVGAFCALAFALPDGDWVFPYLGLFALGVVTFHYRGGMLPRLAFVAAVAAVTAVVHQVQGPLVAGTGAAAAVAIGLLDVRPPRPFRWLGNVSYSLYLVHMPLGMRVVNFGTPFAHTVPAQLAVLAAGSAASLIVAAALYRAVERPCQAWAARVRYRPPQPGAPA